jgi:hypothetical protein
MLYQYTVLEVIICKAKMILNEIFSDLPWLHTGQKVNGRLKQWQLLDSLIRHIQKFENISTQKLGVCLNLIRGHILSWTYLGGVWCLDDIVFWRLYPIGRWSPIQHILAPPSTTVTRRQESIVTVTLKSAHWRYQSSLQRVPYVPVFYTPTENGYLLVLFSLLINSEQACITNIYAIVIHSNYMSVKN